MWTQVAFYEVYPQVLCERLELFAVLREKVF